MPEPETEPACLADYFTAADLDGIVRTLADYSAGADADGDLSERQRELAAACRALAAAGDEDRLPDPPHPAPSGTGPPAQAAPQGPQAVHRRAAEALWGALLAEAHGWADSHGAEQDLLAAARLLPPAQGLELLAACPTPLVPGTLLDAVTQALTALDPAAFPAP